MNNAQKEYERIKKYSRNSEYNHGLYDMYRNEIYAIKNCSPNIYEAIMTAFNFGFEKGCRATRKATEQTA